MKHVGKVQATTPDGSTIPSPELLVLVGPLVNVVLALPDAARAAFAASGQAAPQTTVKLLIDTGAQVTSVHDDVARGLGLPPIRLAPVVGVSGKSEDYPVYRLKVLIAVEDAFSKAMIGIESDIIGMPASSHHADMRGVLGRDFLRHVRLVYDGPNATFELAENAPPPVPLNRAARRRAEREAKRG